MGWLARREEVSKGSRCPPDWIPSGRFLQVSAPVHGALNFELKINPCTLQVLWSEYLSQQLEKKLREFYFMAEPNEMWGNNNF